MQLPEGLGRQRRNQIFLALKVPVRSVVGHPGPACHFPQRQSFRANLSNKLERSFQERSLEISVVIFVHGLSLSKNVDMSNILC